MRIVVTGEGIISAIGCNKKEVLQSLREKRSGISKVRYLKTEHEELPVGEVPLSDDELKATLGIDTTNEMSRTALMAIHAIREAILDAGLSDESLKRKKVALVSGTTVGGMDVTERHFLSSDMDGASAFLRGHHCGGSTQTVADYFPFISECSTISTACSSAANAVIVGSEMLKSDEADIVIAGGTEALSLFHLNGFNSLMILDHAPCRPFDKTRAGLNLGEGAAYVILEKEQAVKATDRPIHAYISGYGNACDAFHQTASSPNGEGAFRAMSEALQMANVKPETVDYINAHGTGTPNNDETEVVAIRRVFGDVQPPVSSTKSFTGHTTSASGSIEMVICLLAMKHDFIPANLNWHDAMEGFAPSMGADNVHLTTVLCNSFGFGGNDSSIVISTKPCDDDDKTSRHLTDDDIEIVTTAEIDNEEDLKRIKEYIKPMEARRMGKLMKASIITSYRVLNESGIESPDAIVTGTAWGCVENSEQILCGLRDGGEYTVKPTLFMQSTHNTISSNIAMLTKCHGYNITYSQGRESMEAALRDARRLLITGQCKNVLVGLHDESTPLLRALLAKEGLAEPKAIYSKSILLRCKK